MPAAECVPGNAGDGSAFGGNASGATAGAASGSRTSDNDGKDALGAIPETAGTAWFSGRLRGNAAKNSFASRAIAAGSGKPSITPAERE
jgi:hypothetical protein